MQMADGPAMPQPKRALSAAERLDWLRLIRTENVGPITFRNLMARFHNAGAALTALPDLAARGGRQKPLKPVSKAEAERELAALAKAGGELIAMVEPDYPPWLAAVDDAPPVIAVRGNRHLLTREMVALVGARNASVNGRRFAQRLAGEIGGAGYVVASGLARGIDAAAHTGALETGTVAAMAGGVDVAYPPENAELLAQIAQLGAAVSENPPGMQPQGRHFPRRNRIIAGLSLGVVVVEAAPRSGSLITARLAGEQGREVFAVPGSPLDPRAQGANGLIREGATLVQTAEDVLEGLQRMRRPPLEEAQPDLFAARPLAPAAASPVDGPEAARARVLECLSPTPTHVDEILRDCGEPLNVVLTILLELELAGRLDRQPGNRVCLV
jgi:DNA processing protein